MKLTPTIYNHYKKEADEAYMDMFYTVLEQVQENTPEEKLEDLRDEHSDLAVDIMLSNILGTVTSFDEVHALFKEKKKISIPLSDNDLQDLQGGETFDWTFDGVDVHLYQTNEDTE